MERAAGQAARTYATADESIRENRIASARLEASYAGHFGKFIEPAIRPLGYDWKIGIALLSSFAAREVFVGTLSTIYSIGSSDEDTNTIREHLQQETDPRTGRPMYTPATSFSLLIFYAFAMMCMSTLAVVHRETKGWTWPAIQFFYMTGLAYVSAWLVYVALR
jgi:ferrous iron transport protein B